MSKQSVSIYFAKINLGGGCGRHPPESPAWGLLMHAQHINAKRFEFLPPQNCKSCMNPVPSVCLWLSATPESIQVNNLPSVCLWLSATPECLQVNNMPSVCLWLSATPVCLQVNNLPSVCLWLSATPECHKVI